MQDGKPKTVLLTLGRLPKALEIARALRAADCRVLVADPFKWHLCRASKAVEKSFQTPSPHKDQALYLSCLLDLAAREKVDLIMPVSEEALHVSLLEHRLPEGTRLFSLPNRTLQGLHDKYTFTRIVTAAGLNCPETYLASDRRAVQLARTRETVLKPRLGCSGQHLRLLSPEAAATTPLGGAETLVQSRVRGREVSTLTLCHNGEVLAHVTYKGLIFAGTVAVCFERVDGLPRVDEWVSEFVRAGGYSHFLAFDFMVDETGTPWPLECNPRLTSGIHFMAADGIARAVTDLKNASSIGLKRERRFQEGHTTLLQVYGNLLRPGTSLRHLRAMLTSKDVLWSRDDRLPFPLMTPYSWPVLKQVLFQGRSFGEAATRDIAWPPDAKSQTSPSTQTANPLNVHGSCS